MFLIIVFSVMNETANVEWILKAPFTSNSRHFKRYINSSLQADVHIAKIHSGFWGKEKFNCHHHVCYIIPYMMLQERVVDNGEVKMCFLGGVFHHFVSIGNSGVRRKFSGYSETELVEFATAVMAALRGRNEYILDGLVRVDLFYNRREDRLVVNELENLEAVYYSANHSEQCNADCWLRQYWKNKIYHCVADMHF